MQTKYTYKRGLIDGLPVFFAYLAVSFTFGVAMTNFGFTPLFATIISGTNLTSAGQFAGANLMAQEAMYVVVFLTVFVINARYILMSLSLSQNLPENTGTLKRMAMSMFVTDEIFAIANQSGKNLNFKYFLGLATLPYVGWTIGTLVGALVNSILPESLQLALGIALYCMFIAIVIPSVKKSKAVCFCVAIAIALSCMMYYIPIFNVIADYQIIISAVVSAIITAIIFPVKEKSEETENNVEDSSEKQEEEL